MAQAAADAAPKEQGKGNRQRWKRRGGTKITRSGHRHRRTGNIPAPKPAEAPSEHLDETRRRQNPGVAEKTQIIYSTHAPLFVGIDRINQIRLLRKMPNEDKPKITKIINTNTDKVAEEIWKAEGEPGPKYTGKQFFPACRP